MNNLIGITEFNYNMKSKVKKFLYLLVIIFFETDFLDKINWDIKKIY